MDESLLTLMSQLESAIQQLTTMLEHGERLQAHVYQLPEIAPGQEHQPIDHIEVTPLQDKPAQHLAIQAYSRFYGHAGAATKTPYRLPGLLHIRGSAAAIAAQVNTINQLKDQFKAAVQALGSRTQKFEVLHRLFPMLITLQVYRHIKCVTRIPNSVRFIWAHKSVVSKVTRDEIIALLEQQLEHPPQHLVTSSEWRRHVQRELNDVLRLPADIPLRQRRNVKVQPLVNLQYPNKQQPMAAPLPLILVSDQPAAVMVGPLTHYDSAQPRRAPQPRQTDPNPLIERIGLYRYIG